MQTFICLNIQSNKLTNMMNEYKQLQIIFQLYCFLIFMIQINDPVSTTHQAKSFAKDSYNIYPLTYSSSSYNPNSIHSNSPIKSSLHLPLYNNNDIQSSVYSFSKPENNYNFNIEPNRVSSPNRYIPNSHIPLSPRTNNSNIIVQRKIQSTQLPSSYSMLNNQQNYVFNNRSSLKSLSSNQYQHETLIPVSQINGPQRQYQRTFTFQSSQPSSQLRQTAAFKNTSKIDGQIYHPDYKIPNRATQIYEVNPQFYEYRTYSVPPISQVSGGYRSTNLFEDHNSNDYTKNNLQSKLLNRQLTDLKSSYGQNIASSRKIMNNEGVQSFPLKFDSTMKQQKDFTGCCGYKGKRVIYESVEKNPFC